MSSWIVGRFLLEGYIDLFACSLLNSELVLKLDIIFTNFSDVVAFVFAFVIFVMVVYLPIKIVKVVEKKTAIMDAKINEGEEIRSYYLDKEEKEHDARWGVFYEGYKEYCNWSMIATVVYVVRRMLFVLIAYYWFEFPAFQLMGNTFLSQWYMMYNNNFKPHKNP
jgi:hypothetical protein